METRFEVFFNNAVYIRNLYYDLEEGLKTSEEIRYIHEQIVKFEHIQDEMMDNIIEAGMFLTRASILGYI